MRLLVLACFFSVAISERYESLSFDQRELADHAFQFGCLSSVPGGTVRGPDCGQLQVVEMTNYRSQVVAGMNHRFTLLLDWDGKRPGNYGCDQLSTSCDFEIFEALRSSGVPPSFDITSDSCCGGIGSAPPGSGAPGALGSFQ